MIYFNADTDKSQILSDNKGKVGIYMWTHIESGRRYVGSAVDLSKRLGYHLHKSYLESFKGISYIYNVLLHYGHSVFSLSILEITYIPNVSKEEARKIILEREQNNIDTLKPEYNINPTAGSRLGSNHSEDTKALLSKINKGINHPMFGKILSGKTKTLISLAMSGENNPMFGKTGENSPLFGQRHSVETKVKMSFIKVGKNNPMYGEYKKYLFIL